jgi:hypothetical protein
MQFGERVYMEEDGCRHREIEVGVNSLHIGAPKLMSATHDTTARDSSSKLLK